MSIDNGACLSEVQRFPLKSEIAIQFVANETAEFENRRVRNGTQHAGAAFLAVDHARFRQHMKLLRNVRLAGADRRHHLAHLRSTWTP